MSRYVTTQVSVNSQNRVIKRSHQIFTFTGNVQNILRLEHSMFRIKANFEKEYVWKSIYLRFRGSLKPSSSICYVLFSSEEKYFGALMLFHKSALKLNQLHQPLMQFISNHAYYQYSLQALTPAPSFILKLLVLLFYLTMCLSLICYIRTM